MTIIRASLLFTLLCLLSTAARVSSQPSTVETASAPSLPEVVQALRARAGSLQNFHVTLSEGGWWRDADEPGAGRDVEPGSADSCRVTTWLRGGDVASTFEWSPDGNVAVGSGGHTVWLDVEQKYRCLIPALSAKDRPTGVVQTGRLNYAETTPSGIFYFELLGLYAFRPRASASHLTATDETLAHWLERQSRETAVSVRNSEWEGQPVILVTVGDPSATPTEAGTSVSSFEYFLSPDKGFMPLARRFTMRGLRVSDSGKGHDLEVVTPFKDVSIARVVRSEELDGVWVPLEVRFDTVQSQSPRREQGQVWVVDDVGLEPVAPDEFEVDFPVGTTVIDQTTQVAYDIVGEGVIQPVIFLPSSENGPATSPPELVRSSLVAFPPYKGFVLQTLLPAEQRAVMTKAMPAEPTGGSNTLLFALVVGGGLVLVVLVVMAIRLSTRFSGNKPSGTRL